MFDQQSDFDAILEAPPGVPSAGPSPTATATANAAPPPAYAEHQGHTAHEVAPSFAEFAASWELYRDPVLASVLAGFALGLAGVFIVLRRAVFVTAAVSQAAGLGVACSFLFAIHAGVDVPPVLSAFLFAGAAALTVALRPPSGLPKEALVGFVYLAASALSIVVGDRISQEAHDISSILFGTAVLVRPFDLALVAAVGCAGSACLVAAARGLTFAGFDPDAARVQGLPVPLLEAGLWLLVAAEVAVATRALGALPVFAFAVLPALAALRLARRQPRALATGALLGAIAGGAGYVSAFMLELPVGASQAALAAVLSLLGLAVGRLRR